MFKERFYSFQMVTVRRISAHFASALRKNRGVIMKSLVREYSDNAAVSAAPKASKMSPSKSEITRDTSNGKTSSKNSISMKITSAHTGLKVFIGSYVGCFKMFQYPA